VGGNELLVRSLFRRAIVTELDRTAFGMVARAVWAAVPQIMASGRAAMQLLTLASDESDET
jgi:hypothetical protein